MADRLRGSRRMLWLTLLVTVSLLAAVSLGWGMTKKGLEGKSAADFTLKDVLQGTDYTLSQYKGKVVLLNFFTFFCAPCREEMPDLNKIFNDFKDKGFQTLGIALGSDPTQIRFLIKQLGLEYPVLMGTDKVSQAYGDVAVVPTTIIIDKDGKIKHAILGTRKKEEFVKMIQPLL